VGKAAKFCTGRGRRCWNWNDGEEVRAARKSVRGDGARGAQCVEVELQRKWASDGKV
jgi:hypothetical protein